MANWKNIHPDFTSELQKEWEKRGFSYKDVKGWVDTSLMIHDFEYARWLKLAKCKKSWLGITDPKLRVEYQEWKKWVDIHEDFAEYSWKSYYQSSWKNRGFTLQETKKWIEAGLFPCRFELASILKEIECTPKKYANFSSNKAQEWLNYFYSPKIRSGIAKIDISDWYGPHRGYDNKKLVGSLKLVGFSNLEKFSFSKNELTNLDISTCVWLEELNCSHNKLTELDISKNNNLLQLNCSSNELREIVLKNNQKLNGFDFIDWLTYNKFWTDKWFLREEVERELQTEYQEFLEEVKNGSKLDMETIRQLKSSSDYHKLIPNETLKERYKKYGLCPTCQQPAVRLKLCTCSFQRNFKNWTSGNSEIDKFIQNSQLNATCVEEVTEWIPYEKFTNIEYLAEGGFGKVYKGEWIDGPIDNFHFWSGKSDEWIKRKKYSDKTIVLKSLNDSQNATAKFLQEITYHKLFSSSSIVKCHGISRNPNTRNYLMVMDYMVNGSLRQYLNSNYNKLNFEDKIYQLHTIAHGLKYIHEKGLTHRDLHPGNILSSGYDSCRITDFGLCRPVSEKDESKIYGVLSYIAPEVLQGQPYTQASDIYSFGIVAYEVLSGLPPYHEYAHDDPLAVEICEGKRPNFQIKISPLLENLIKNCWDINPKKRPVADDLSKSLWNWREEYIEGVYRKESTKLKSEFAKQAQPAEEFNRNKQQERLYKALSQLYPQFKDQVKALRPKDQWKVTIEKYSEFCKRYGYEENYWFSNKKKQKKEFDKLLFLTVNGISIKNYQQNTYTSRLLLSNISSSELSLIWPSNYLSKDLNFDIETETKKTTEKDSYLSKELNFDIESPKYYSRELDFDIELTNQTETSQDLTTRFKRQLSLDSQNITSQDKNKLTRVIDKEQKYYLEPMEIDNYDWQNSHPTLTSHLISSWYSHHFTSQETQNWLNIGLQPTEASFAAWLRDFKHLAPEEVLNQGDYNQLKQEFLDYQQLQTQQEQPPK